MNFKFVFQAISSALQSKTTTPPPVPATPVQNRTGLPIPEAILMDLDLLDQDQNHAISWQSISTTQPPIRTTQMQHDSMPANQDSDDELLDVAQPQDWATASAIARQSISMALPLIPTASIQQNSVPTPGFLPDHTHAQDQSFAIARQSISIAPLPIPTTTTQHNLMPLPLIAQYPSKEALFKAIQAWAKPYRYAFSIGRSIKREGSGRIKVVYICDRRERPRLAPTREHIRNTTSRGIGCPFSVIASELPLYQG